jgi:glycosyltransferase involved in cell wall biosynthesis
MTTDWPGVTIVSQENKGSAGATNRAIALARMPYIKFLDADDLLVEDATQTLLDALQGTGACLAYGDRIHFKPEERIDTKAVLGDQTGSRLIEDPLPRVLRNALFNPSQFLVRTDCVKKVGGCDERIVHSQEYSLALRLASRWPFLELEKIVAFVQTADSGALSSNRAMQLKRVTMATAYFLEDAPQTPDDLQQYVCRRSAKRAAIFVRRNYRSCGIWQWYGKVLQTYLPGRIANQPEFIKDCARAFDPPYSRVVKV